MNSLLIKALSMLAVASTSCASWKIGQHIYRYRNDNNVELYSTAMQLFTEDLKQKANTNTSQGSSRANANAVDEEDLTKGIDPNTRARRTNSTSKTPPTSEIRISHNIDHLLPREYIVNLDNNAHVQQSDYQGWYDFFIEDKDFIQQILERLFKNRASETTVAAKQTTDVPGLTLGKNLFNTNSKWNREQQLSFLIYWELFRPFLLTTKGVTDHLKQGGPRVENTQILNLNKFDQYFYNILKTEKKPSDAFKARRGPNFVPSADDSHFKNLIKLWDLLKKTPDFGKNVSHNADFYRKVAFTVCTDIDLVWVEIYQNQNIRAFITARFNDTTVQK